MKTKTKCFLKICCFFIFIVTIIYFLKFKNFQNKKNIVVKSTPTLFIHGWGSSVKAEHQMTSYILNKGISNNITKAIVNTSGHVDLVGQIPDSAMNPLVEVGFENNRTSDYHQNGKWLKKIIIQLQKKYKIKYINLVGHSMGNMAIAYYLLDNSKNSKLPKLQKHVAIAGHFNGIIGINDKSNKINLDAKGRPNHMDFIYRELLDLRNKYPYKQVNVLNIYGDKNDGTHSDGRVTNASSQSLRYLIKNRSKSYIEKKIIGPNGQHSRLHENKEVDQILINFLWPRK